MRSIYFNILIIITYRILRLSSYNTPFAVTKEKRSFSFFFYNRFSLFTYFIYTISRLQYYNTIVLYITIYPINISHSGYVLILVLGIHTIYRDYLLWLQLVIFSFIFLFFFCIIMYVIIIINYFFVKNSCSLFSILLFIFSSFVFNFSNSARCCTLSSVIIYQ